MRFSITRFLDLVQKIYTIKFQLNRNFCDNFFCYTMTCIIQISIYAIFGLPRQAHKPGDYCNLIGSMMVIKIKNFFILFMNMSLNLTLSVILNNGLNNMKQTDPKLIQGIKFS